MPGDFPYINPIFQPAMRIISAISQSNPVSVTTSFNHLYISGNIVRLDIPKVFGMPQMNGVYGPIIVTSPTTFTMPIDSTNYQAFVIPDPAPATSAQVVPFAEINSQLTAAVQNTRSYMAP